MSAALHRALGVTAAALGALALVAGSVSPDTNARPRAADASQVTAVQLATWIRDRKPGLRVIDVRSPSEFADFQIPTAENASPGELARTRFRPDETVVLYADSAAPAVQPSSGRVLALRGGLLAWITSIQTPTIPANATAAERAAFDSVAELSRYFGGVPRVVAPRPATSPAQPNDGGGIAAALRRAHAFGC